MNRLQDDEKKDFVQQMRIQIGCTFTDNFKQYIFKKMSDSPLLKYF
jgi:hypothetical protein